MFSCCGGRWASLGGLQRSASLSKPRERYAHLAKPTGHSTTHTGAWVKHTCRTLKNLPHPGNLSCSLWDWLGPFPYPKIVCPADNTRCLQSQPGMHCATIRHLPWVSRGPRIINCEHPAGEKTGPADPQPICPWRKLRQEGWGLKPQTQQLCLQCQHQPVSTCFCE